MDQIGKLLSKNIDAGTYRLQNSYVYYKFDLREVWILHFGFNVLF